MSNHGSSPSQIDQKSPENPQSTRKIFWVFVLYALSRSIKSSSSYLQPFNQYLDKLTEKNPTANCDKLLDAYHLRVQPLATTAQLFSYVFFVLTSSIIGFDIIIWLDIFCQIANVLLVAALYFEPFRKIFISQLAALVYGVATATGNVFHQYAYCVFDKSMFHKISGATRSATMSGHFLGGIFGIIASFFMYEDSNWIGMYESLGTQPANFDEIKLSMYKRFVKIILFLMVTTAICMLFSLVVSFFFPKISKEAKAKNRKSVSQVLKSIVKATHQFTNPSVTFWGISWYLSFMCMLYCKTWAIPHFKQQQIRLNAPVWNSYADVFSYAAGAVGSLVPKKCLSLFGYQGTVTIQLFVSLAAAACAVGLSWEWPNIMGFYIPHVVFTFLVYFSMAFQSGELARCVAPDQNKLVFYLLTFSVFLTQEFLNKVIFEGIGHCSEVPVIKRYIYMALFMGFNFLLVFVGFSGTSRGEQKKSDEMKKDLEKVASPRQEQQQEIVHSKKE